ncbi:hypothetical protein ACTFIR_012825 [Dictyostelium discoideum]
MTSVYGDLILQDGTKVINKSGSQILIKYPIEIYNLTLQVYLVPSGHESIDDPAHFVDKKTTSVPNDVANVVNSSIYNLKIDTLVIQGIPDFLIDKKKNSTYGSCTFIIPGGQLYNFPSSQFVDTETYDDVTQTFKRTIDLMYTGGNGWSQQSTIARMCGCNGYYNL